MDFNTIFDGWGTELIGILIGLFLTGVGIWYYKKGRVNQKQKAGDYAKQKQEVKKGDEKKIRQKQKAGDNSEQTQIG